MHPIATSVRKPNSKGKVESAVRYIKHNALVNGRFKDLEALNCHLERWSLSVCDQHNINDPFLRGPKTPAERWLIEKPALRPNRKPPIAMARYEERAADKNGLIRVDNAMYRVPDGFARRDVQLVVVGDTITVRCGGQSVILDKAGERPALVNGGSLASLSPETQRAIGALRRNGTDWGREIYRTALNQQYSVSISGGSGKTGYYFSGGYYNEQGTTVGTGFERLNLTLKTDYDLLKNLRFGASVFVGQNKNDSYLSDTDVFTNPSRYTRTVNPYLNAYNPDGSYAYDPDMTVNTGNTDVLDFNILEERDRTENPLKTRSIKTIFDQDYRPVKGLKLYTQFGLQVDNSATEKMAQENTYFTRKYQLKSMVDQVVRLPKGGVIQNWNGDLSQYNWKAQAEYAGTFGGKHELDLMAGLEMRGVTNTTVHTKGFGYDHKTMTTKPINVPEDSDLLDDESFRQYTKSFYENRYMSYFFTGSYTYDNRYTVFGSMRYDGTNLFGVDPKYKFNPMWSISGAWSINRERFLRDARWLDNLRLRVSYGAQGNYDRTTSTYILGTWNSTSLGGASEDRIDVTSPPIQNLRWETTYSWNTALDLAAL